MFPEIGPLEIGIVLIIALIVFGPKRLPELGKSLGKGISEFREGMSKIGDDDDDDAPAALTTPEADPEATEIDNSENRKPPASEPVESEEIKERQD